MDIDELIFQLIQIKQRDGTLPIVMEIIDEAGTHYPSIKLDVGWKEGDHMNFDTRFDVKNFLVIRES